MRARRTAIGGLLHLARLSRLDVPRRTIAGAHGWVQINEEGEDVEGEDKGDNPFEDGSGVAGSEAGCDGEGDGQGELDEHEGEFYPEGDAEDAVVSVAWEV